MAKKRSRRFIGRTLHEHVDDQRAKDPEFAAEWDKRQLAHRVRALREARKLTQAQIAVRAGTTQSAVARLESGEIAPTLDLLQKIAAAMGLQVTVGFRRKPGMDSPLSP